MPRELWPGQANHNSKTGAKDVTNPKKETELASSQEVQEQREAILEGAKEKRTELFIQVFISRVRQYCTPEATRVFLKWLNNIPYVGDVNIWKGAITGREAGKMLTPGERFNYIATGTMSALSLLALSQRNLKAAAIRQAVAYAFVNIDTVPYTLLSSAKMLENKTPKLAHMMNAVADYILQKREDMVELAKSLIDDQLIILYLNSSEE